MNISLNKFFVGLFICLILLSCEKKEEISPNSFKVFKSKGILDATFNEKEWLKIRPKVHFSTLVYFNESFVKQFNCNDTKVITFIIQTFYEEIHSDIFFMINIDLLRPEDNNNMRSLRSDFNNSICLPGTVSLSISESDVELASYIIDLSYTNAIELTSISKDTIEGKFDLKFIEGRTFNGEKNPHLDIPNKVNFKANRFIAIRDSIF
jgi:hypothetical protein